VLLAKSAGNVRVETEVVPTAGAWSPEAVKVKSLIAREFAEEFSGKKRSVKGDLVGQRRAVRNGGEAMSTVVSGRERDRRAERKRNVIVRLGLEPRLRFPRQVLAR
jgi:hypothetical protein